MKIFASILTALLVIGFTGSAYAAKDKGLKGKVVSVAADKITITTGGKAAAQQVDVAVDANTKVTIDGVADKKVTDIQPGAKVVVTPATGTATLITVTTKGAGKKAK